MKRLSIFFAALMACTLSFAQTTFEKVTAAPADWSGEYLLVYESSATEAYVWNGLDAAKGCTAATIADGKITADGLVTITIAATTESNYSIKVNGSDNDGKYISGTSNSNKLNFADKASDNTITYEDNSVKIVSNTSVMRFNAASDQLRYRYYQSTKYTKQKPVQLYKKATGGETPVTPVAVESVALDQTEVSIEAGKTATLVATITPANATNKNVTWATDNDKVATVADGVVTAVAEGKANITVTTVDGEKTATCAVTVTPVPAVDGMNYSVNFTKAADAKTWTIVNKNLGSLSKVWAQDNTYGYKGSAYSGSCVEAESWVVSPKLDLSKAEVATMTINHALNQLKGNANTMMVKGTKDGETWVELEVNGWPAGTNWTYNDATVDLTSVISATTQIAFVYKSTTKVAPTWEIKTVAIKGSEAVHATEVKLDKETLELEQYKNSQLTATLTPAEATDIVEWASDDEEVATVSATGVVTAVGVGTANITATAGSVSATCAVTVVTATPITCAEAVEIAKTVKTNNAAEGGKYVIRGYVTALVGTPADDMNTYKNYSVWMADTKDGGKVFEAYQVKPVDGETIAAVGNFVEVVGDITQYTKDGSTTYETMGKGTATIQVLPNPSTALDDINADGVVVEKVVRNGQVLIIRDGKTYNVIGKMVD